MKKLISMLVALAIIPCQMLFASGQSEQIPSEKKSQLIETAVKVCGVMAPGFDLSGLTPMVHGPTEMEFPSADFEVSKKLESRKVVTVDFMKDPSKYFSVRKQDPKTGKTETVSRPVSEIMVRLNYDTMEPVSFYPPGSEMEYGISFDPSYEAFLKSHKYENGKWVRISEN